MKTLIPSSKTILSLLMGMFVTITIAGKTHNRVFGSEMETFNAVYKGEFDLILPKNNQNEKLPVYIVLPGGVGTKKYPNFKKDFIIPGIEHMQGIVFSPKISWKRPDKKALEHIIIDFINAARNSYPIDDKKIVLIGYSNGALQSIKLVKDNDHLFSALIVVASNFEVSDKINTPIYVVHGTKDRYFSIKKAYKNVNAAKDLGCNITFVVAEGKNDYGAAQYVNELNDSMAQIENNIWSQSVEYTDQSF
ncbi:dienelactone hydrolase family protein [Aquimarina spinulae]|uniref:dienelactone hydrolase family protein n=1 Tax=Aquimarina spinulae TaxID=1192023 RepID=UPI00131F0362|nr:dienelactone hydrolase family protein [Aquimarina spinulae]